MSTISVPPTTSDHGADALLDEIESVLGFSPVESLVLRIRRRRRSFAVLRVDLPPSCGERAESRPPGIRRRDGTDPVEAQSARLAHALTGMLAKVAGATAVEFVVYTAGVAEAHRRLVDVVSARLESAGYPTEGVHCVTGSRWAALRRGSPRPPADLSGTGESGAGERATVLPGSDDWHERRTSPAAPSAPGATREGDAVGAQGGFVPIVPTSELRRARALASLAALQRSEGLVGDDDDEATLIAEWSAILEPGADPPSDARAISLAWALRRTVIRDCVLMQCAWGGLAGLRTLADVPPAGSGRRPDAHVGRDRRAAALDGGVLDTVLGVGETCPRPEVVERSIEVLRRLVACVPESISAPPLSMLAWLEWSRGRGSTAAAYLAEARRRDPRYRLARLFRCLVDTGRTPDWLLR